MAPTVLSKQPDADLCILIISGSIGTENVPCVVDLDMLYQQVQRNLISRLLLASSSMLPIENVFLCACITEKLGGAWERG